MGPQWNQSGTERGPRLQEVQHALAQAVGAPERAAGGRGAARHLVLPPCVAQLALHLAERIAAVV